MRLCGVVLAALLLGHTAAVEVQVEVPPQIPLRITDVRVDPSPTGLKVMHYNLVGGERGG